MRYIYIFPHHLRHICVCECNTGGYIQLVNNKKNIIIMSMGNCVSKKEKMKKKT